jgi:hypothetical protein
MDVREETEMKEAPHDLGMHALKVLSQIGTAGGFLLMIAGPGMQSWLSVATGLIIMVICGATAVQLSVETDAREELEQLARTSADHSAGFLLVPGGIVMLLGILVTLTGIPAGFYGSFWFISLLGLAITIAGSLLIAFLAVFEYVLAPISINHARAVLSHVGQTVKDATVESAD